MSRSARKNTEARQGLNKIIHLLNTTKISHCKPALFENTNIRIGKAKFYSLRILLYSRVIFYIVLGKHTKYHVTKKPIWSHVSPKVVNSRHHIPPM